MRRILKRIVLALTGLGLIAGSGVADAPRQLHDEVRHRVLNELNLDQTDLDALRAALAVDPDFGLLLEYYRQGAVDANHRSPLAADAAQEALLKIWKRKPRLFLEPHDDVVRYFHTATRHNLISEFRKAALRKSRTEGRILDREGLPRDRHADPAEEAAARDLFDRLVSSLNGTDRAVLDACLSGFRSSRGIGRELGISRYAAGRSRDKIRQLLNSGT